MVLEVLSREFHINVPWELLYAHDLVLIIEMLEEYISELKAWKPDMENKRLCVKDALKYNSSEIFSGVEFRGDRNFM